MRNLVAALGVDELDAAEDSMVSAAEQARADCGVAEKERCEVECPVLKAGRFKAVRAAKKKLNQAMVSLVQALEARAVEEGNGHDAARRARKDKARLQKKAQMAEKKEKEKEGRPTRAWRRLQRVEAAEEESTTVAAATCSGSRGVGDVADSQATLAVRAAHATVKRARVQLRLAVARDNAYFMRLSRTKAPRSHWKAQALVEQDSGNPEEHCTKLLQHLTNAKGQMVTRDPAKIRVAILEHVRSGFEVRSDLPVACETGITEALAITSFVNKETCNQPGSVVHAESVMAKTAAVPLEVWAAIDARRQKPSRAEQVQDALDALADEAKAGVPSCQSFVKRQAVQTAYAGAYAALQAEYTVAEVQSAMEKIRDVGSGSDELEPVVFTGHRELHDEARCRMCSRAAAALAAEDEGSGDAAFPDRTCYTAEAACLLFNRVRREGRIPTRWRLHRCLMHYKKHGLDPHHLGSYRGLGVDQALLKLMSLVMNERLEAYLTATGALSRSQGGFQRLKGPAEQAFTLAETVRFALQKKNVHIAYVDIERAYDSVQHPLLWKYCVEKGIDGLFLGTLQAIYYQAQAQLDVGGFLLDCVLLEQGVFQYFQPCRRL